MTGSNDRPKTGFGAADAFSFLSGPRGRIVPTFSPALPSPPEPQVNDKQITSTVYYRTMDALRSGRTADTIAAAVAAAGELADRIWAELRPAVEGRKQPGFACKAGCGACCHQQVSIAPAEAVTIARHLRNTLTADAFTAIKARLVALDDRTRGLGIWGRAKLKAPCAFLVEGSCSIYEVRPLRCRGLFSRDVSHCEWVKENPDSIYGHREKHTRPGPYPTEPPRVMDAAINGLSRAVSEFGLHWEALELIAAMRIALEIPDSPERYAAGERVLDAAALPARDDQESADARRD